MTTVREAMTDVVLTVGPSHMIGDVARLMADKGVGAAIVVDPDSPGPGIITERDILRAVASTSDTVGVFASQYMSQDLIFAEPEWDLERAAEIMIDNNFRHLLVVDGGELKGIISMRDIVASWVRLGLSLREATR